MVLSIKDQQAQYNQLMKGFKEGKEAGLRIAADPLPPPDRDTRQRPNPNKPAQSPWLPGKSPAVPGQGLVHNPMEVDSLIDKWGAVWDEKDNRWLMPPDSPNGNYRPATDEEAGMLDADFQHRQMYDRNQPHPHQASVNYGSPTPLDILLKPAQEKYGPGLRGMPEKERKELLIKGTKV